MEKLEQYMKECNLVFTDTIDRKSFCIDGFDINKVRVNYNDSVSLLYLISSFNKLYLAFKKEYDNLDKLNLGKDIEVLNFEKYNYNGDNYRVLTIYLDKPTIAKQPDTKLYLREINGKLKPFVTNDKSIHDKDYYYENVILNNDISKKYLDLFEKYELLLDIYNHLKNNQVFGDGVNTIYTVIDEHNSNLLNGLNEITISLGSDYFNTDCFVEILVNLGENFSIDYDNCKLVLYSENIKENRKDYDKIMSNIYVNKKYIKTKNVD